MDDPVMMMTHFTEVERGNTPCADMTHALFLSEMGNRDDDTEAAAAEILLPSPSSEASAAAAVVDTLITEHEPEMAARDIVDVTEHSGSSNSSVEVTRGSDEGHNGDVDSSGATTEDNVHPSCSVCDMSEGLFKPKHCECPPTQATCTNCQLGYAAAVLSEGRSGGLQCAGGCGARLTYRDLRDLKADATMMETFQRLRASAVLRKGVN
jgi:hypothetical protein